MSKEDSIIARPISRRTFAKVMGAAGAVAGIGGGAAKIFMDAPQAFAADGTLYTSCKICDALCGIKAVTVGGKTEFFGNPDCQQAGVWDDGKGRLCVKGYAGEGKTMNPDRVLFPMKRTNPNKGMDQDPGFVKITWAEAYALVAAKLNTTIAQYGPKSVVFPFRGGDFGGRLAHAIGSPNVHSHVDTCFRTHAFAWGNMVLANGGAGRPWTIDFSNTTYVLSFGYDQIGKAQNPTVQGLIRALDNGAKMTVFDPRKSTTAVKALHYGGRYYAVKPGTDLAIMWAIIKWIIDNNKWDASFVTASVDVASFADLQAFVTSGAGVAYTPAWAEGISGVPAAEIVAVAQEFTNNGDYTNWRPCVPTHKRDGAGGPNYANSWRSSMAEVILSALVGSVDRSGGQILDRNFAPKNLDALFSASKHVVTSEIAPRADKAGDWKMVPGGSGSWAGLFRAIVDEDPYPVRFMLTGGYNLPMCAPDTQVVVAAMAKCFVANVCYYADEAAWMSDVLLPEMSMLEKSTFLASGSATQRKYKAIQLVEKVVTPLGSTKPLPGTVAAIADAADAVANGGGYTAACQAYCDAHPTLPPAFMTNRDSLRKFFTTDGTAAGTLISGGALADAQLAELKLNAGFPYASMAEFIAAEGGAAGGHGLWPNKAEAPAFVNYAGLGTKKVFLKLAGVADGAKIPGNVAADVTGFPTWNGKRASVDGTYKFFMVTDREPQHVHTESKAEELMNELSGSGKLTMSTAAAIAAGIADGDTVIVTSRVGVQECQVRLSDHIRPDTVHMMHGWGSWALSASKNYNADGSVSARKWGLNAAAGIGANDSALIPHTSYAEHVVLKDPSRSANMQDVVVSVVKK